MKKKIKLVMSGSGTLYPTHAGSVLKLAEMGFEFESIAGCSGGAIIATALATGYKPNNELVKIIKATLPIKNGLLDFSLWSLFSKWGMMKGDKIEAMFDTHFIKHFKEAKIPLHIVATNIEREVPRIFSTDTDPEMSIAKAVRASMSIPGIFVPVSIDGELYVDGGVTANFPWEIFGNGQDVVGLRFGAASSVKDFKQSEKKPLKGVADYINANISALIDASSKIHMEDDIYNRTIFLKSAHSSMNFKMTEADVDSMIEEGYRSVEQWASRLKL